MPQVISTIVHKKKIWNISKVIRYFPKKQLRNGRSAREGHYQDQVNTDPHVKSSTDDEQHDLESHFREMNQCQIQTIQVMSPQIHLHQEQDLCII